MCLIRSDYYILFQLSHSPYQSINGPGPYFNVHSNFCRRIPSGHTMGTMVTPLYVQRWSLVSNVSAPSLWTPDQNHIQHPLGIGQRSSTGRQWTARERSRGTLTSDTRGHIWAGPGVYDSVPIYNHLLLCDQSYFVSSHDGKWATSIHWWNVFGGSRKLVNEPWKS